MLQYTARKDGKAKQNIFATFLSGSGIWLLYDFCVTYQFMSHTEMNKEFMNLYTICGYLLYM